MSFAIYFIGVFAVVLVMLSSYFLGERKTSPKKVTPYEGGIVATGSTRVHFFAQYFLVAILFVAFDVESVFVYLWATSLKVLGPSGFFAMAFFIAVLTLSLVYAFSMGVLNLGPRPRRLREAKL
jgi:NADH-quinone oxidoreductase subunit A